MPLVLGDINLVARKENGALETKPNDNKLDREALCVILPRPTCLSRLKPLMLIS